MDSPKKISRGYSESDGDVGLLLYKIGHNIKLFFIWIGRGLVNLGHAIVAVFAFLFRNIIWLAVGALAGLLFGYYNYAKQGAQFTAQMTVKTNFNSSRSLYNTIEYLNSLIAANKTDELSKTFGITAQEADQLVEFSCHFVESEIITADMYKQQFMQYDPRIPRLHRDTFWLRTIKYDDFKESLTKFDYPFHEVEVKSHNPSIFTKLEKGISAYISNISLLQELRNQQVQSSRDEEKVLTSALQNIDSLRQAYNQRLARGEEASPQANQLMLLQNNPEIRTPELELYDKMMELLDELKKSRQRNSTEKNVIEVLSTFNPIGKKLTFLQQNGLRDILTGLGVSLIILVALVIYKKLTAIENSKRVNRSL